MPRWSLINGNDSPRPGHRLMLSFTGTWISWVNLDAFAGAVPIHDFAPNLSFFFSNGMDPEYTVIGRVARRIWARAMRERYGASPRSQMLKYHIQTSGHSLHAQVSVQRHPHHPASALRAIRQGQLPAHQRLRRGN